MYKRPAYQICFIIAYNDLFVLNVLSEQHKARVGHSHDKTKQWESRVNGKYHLVAMVDTEQTRLPVNNYQQEHNIGIVLKLNTKGFDS